MSVQLTTDSDIDGAIQSPASSEQSKTKSDNYQPTEVVQSSEQQDFEVYNNQQDIDRMRSIIMNHQSPNQIMTSTSVENLSFNNLINNDDNNKSISMIAPTSEITMSSNSTSGDLNKTNNRQNPSSRGKAKMIMVGGHPVESGGIGNHRSSRNEMRSSNSRNQFFSGEWLGGGDHQDGHSRGPKILDEQFSSQYGDFGDPFLELFNATQPSVERMTIEAHLTNVLSNDQDQQDPNTSNSANELFDLPAPFVPPLPPHHETAAPSTPIASPS